MAVPIQPQQTQKTVLLTILIAGAVLLPLLGNTVSFTIAQSSTDCGGMSWLDCAKIAWRYFLPYPQGAWNPSTGLHYDAYNWHFFTNWGLAAYIIALVHANQLGIVDNDYPFYSRASKVLTFLNTQQFTPTGLPYSTYDATTGQPATNLDPNLGPTDAADYGRLLIALHLLRDEAMRMGFPELVSQVNSAVGRVDTTKVLASGSKAYDFYSYYVFQGFLLWGRSDLDVSWLDETAQNGPWVDPSQMFGVPNVPLTKINSEPIADFILELNPSANFMMLARNIYLAQDARWRQTGNLTAWAEGGLSVDPYFIYEMMVLPPNNYWVILPGSQKPGVFLAQNGRLPVVFTKTALAWHAIFHTAYTSALSRLLIQHSPTLYDSRGFYEGTSESSVTDDYLHVQTPEMVIDAAHFASPPQTTTSSSSAASSSTSVTSSASSAGTSSTSSAVSTTPISTQIPELSGPELALLTVVAVASVLVSTKSRKRTSAAAFYRNSDSTTTRKEQTV